MVPQRAVLNFCLNFSYKEKFTVSYKFLSVIFSWLSIKIIEYSRFQNNYFWKDNIFIRRENCEFFCFYCDLKGFEQR